MSTPSNGVSPLVLVLSVLLAVAVTVAAMFALRPNPSSTASVTTSAASDVPVEPLTQKDTVSPKRDAIGKVIYPMPFAVPPSVKLTAAKREYRIDKQDEYGFTWHAELVADDFPPTLNKDTVAMWVRNFSSSFLGNLKEGLVFEDFTWEAKGVRGGVLPPRVELTGTFNTLPNTDGEVAYEIPFAQPAHVELSGNNNVTVTEARASGFKWKNVTEKGKEWFGSGTVTWTARGVRGSGR